MAENIEKFDGAGMKIESADVIGLKIQDEAGDMAEAP